VDGIERAVRAKTFALPRLFVENPERLIDRDEIMRAVWPDVFVTDDSTPNVFARSAAALTMTSSVCCERCRGAATCSRSRWRVARPPR
jgi:hypothetical protein